MKLKLILAAMYAVIGGTLSVGGVSIFQAEWWIVMASVGVIDVASHMSSRTC